MDTARGAKRKGGIADSLFLSLGKKRAGVYPNKDVK